MYEYQIVVIKKSQPGMIEYIKQFDSDLSEKTVRAQFVKEHQKYDTSEYTIEVSCFECLEDIEKEITIDKSKGFITLGEIVKHKLSQVNAK